MVKQLPTTPDVITKPTRYSVGEKFEQKVYELIQRYFPKALKEVYIYINESRIIEIDTVVIHTSGIYIFEAKFKRGKIYGHPNKMYWKAQHTEFKASKFYNPLRQTEAHIRYLARKYRFSPYSCHTFIVFNNDADISEIQFSTNRTTVCSYNNLPTILKQLTANTNTSISPFILENIYHDMAHKSGVEKYRNIHKESFIQRQAKRTANIRRKR